MWLLNYEFSDTILVITKQKIVFAVSSKKSRRYLFDIIQYRVIARDNGVPNGL